jgi:hypothetical protein
VNASLVITSISAPNQVLHACAAGCGSHGMDFILIGDTGSPADFSLGGCDYWSIARQRSLSFALAGLLPERSYARKNLGYLLAMERGAEIIIETDDDNWPLEPFWAERVPRCASRQYTNAGWVNVYRHFTDALIWPRGFPLEQIKAPQPAAEGSSAGDHYCPIQQGLVNGNPDVDAIYRLTQPLPHDFRETDSLSLGSGCWSPFNSQNTTWFRDAFPLLYLPSGCSFRMTDIWRSFVAMRICWANEWGVLFHAPTVKQERNQHDLLADFSAELAGYLGVRAICHELSRLAISPGRANIPENLLRCYRLLEKLGVMQTGETGLLAAWIKDVENTGGRNGDERRG